MKMELVCQLRLLGLIPYWKKNYAAMVTNTEKTVIFS
jgi:hypothetical protein